LTHTGGCLYSFVYYSWRWTRTVSETCRVIIKQVKQKLNLVGYLLIRYPVWYYPPICTWVFLVIFWLGVSI